MSKPRYSRPRHVLVENILHALNVTFLQKAQCYFGGATRIVLDLAEYRESADIDLLCSSREGYRELRSTIRNNSLGQIAPSTLRLAREVVADRYGIRTFVTFGGEKIKFEIVNENRIDLSGSLHSGLSVPCLSRVSCFAEKFLANDDRWDDEAVLSRDVIDLAFMIEGWDVTAALQGCVAARSAYGDSVDAAAVAAARKLIEKKDYLKKCVAGLRVTHTGTLMSGLKTIAAGKWTGVRRRGSRKG